MSPFLYEDGAFLHARVAGEKSSVVQYYLRHRGIIPISLLIALITS